MTKSCKLVEKESLKKWQTSKKSSKLVQKSDKHWEISWKKSHKLVKKVIKCDKVV